MDGVNDLALEADVSFPDMDHSSPNIEMPQNATERDTRTTQGIHALRYDALKAQQAKKVARGLLPQFPPFPEPNFLYTKIQTDHGPTDHGPTD